MENVGCCFTNPFTVQPAFLSQLYLVLAIGLILANHDITTHSGLLISKLQMQREFYAESFFKNARGLADFHPDFESANLATIEIILLIAIWKLVSWRRDSAHHYLGEFLAHVVGKAHTDSNICARYCCALSICHRLTSRAKRRSVLTARTETETKGLAKLDDF